MDGSEEITRLLTEIRDAQREHLSEYRANAKRAIDLQQVAVERQEKIGRLYKRIVVFGITLIAFIIVLIIYLLTKLR